MIGTRLKGQAQRLWERDGKNRIRRFDGCMSELAESLIRWPGIGVESHELRRRSTAECQRGTFALGSNWAGLA